MEIKNRWNGEVIYKSEKTTMREALEEAIRKNADLSSANLWSANLRYADLRSANLRYADLWYANLGYANLGYANLGYADLRYANLGYANLGYANLPSPTMVLLAVWGELSPELTADLMLFDASAHPDPSAFDRWAQGGSCPYAGVKVQRAANFQEKKELWGKGQACRPYDLMVRVLNEKCPEWSEEQQRAFIREFEERNKKG